MIEYIMIAIKGLAIGASMLVPGVSGGTMAMILNIYDDLIGAINSITRLKFKKLPYLIFFGVGALLGFVLLSKPMLWLLTNYEKPTLFFFMGAVVGGLPIMFKEAKIKKFSFYWFGAPLFIAIGFAIVYAIGNLPENLLQVDLNAGITGYVVLFLAGIFMAAALILPGISTSFMLLTLGIYETTLAAISNLYLPFLIPLGLGLVAGILVTTGILELAMKRFTQATYLIIIGFVLGSVIETIPGMPATNEIAICVILFIVATIVTNRLAALNS